MKRWGVLAMLVSGCAGAPKAELDSKAMRDPATLHAYFVQEIRAGNFANAHKTLAPDAAQRLPYEGFYFIVQHELVQRLLTSFEQVSVDVEGGSVHWRSREFGLDRRYKLAPIKRRAGTIYHYDFTEEQLQELRDAAWNWFKAQKRAADYRMYTYPPDWHYTPLP